ncbi:MAG: M48 family metallopeptidase [Candidatus Sumerlaeia bacterium]|nr:M48 family metallopeptidase [Candidatus Sumerlaeia bacterium]
MSLARHRRRTAELRAAERFALEHPHWHALRMRLTMLVGRAYWAGVLLVTVLLAGLLLLGGWGMLVSGSGPGLAAVVLFPVGVFFFGILAGLFDLTRLQTRLPPGLILTRKDAPRLFDEIERLRRELRVRRPHRVLLSTDFNAGILVVPRWGGLGRSTSVLSIGLPLMQGLSADAMRAVLAHELAHVSGRTNRFTRRATTFCRKWWAIAEATGNCSALGDLVLGGFVRWYLPRLNKSVHGLIRAIEFEADRLATEVAGAETSRQCLASISALGALLEWRFWPAVHERVARQSEPEGNIFAEQRAFLRDADVRASLPGWLSWTLQRRGDVADSHPTPRERLVALGCDPDDAAQFETLLPILDGPTAAEHFLADAEEEYVTVLGNTWLRQVAPQWKQDFREMAQGRTRMEVLLRRVAAGENIEPPEHLELIGRVEALEGRRAAYLHARRFAEQHPEHVLANFHFGRLLVQEGDERGIPYLEFAIDSDPYLVEQGCALVCGFLYSRGRFDEARDWERRAAEARVVCMEAQTERESIDADDAFEPHEAEADRLELLTRRMEASATEIRRAWLVRKRVEVLPERTLHVLVIEPRDSRVWDDAAFDRLLAGVSWGGALIVLVSSGRTRRIVRKIRRVEGSLICPRPKEKRP